MLAVPKSQDSSSPRHKGGGCLNLSPFNQPRSNYFGSMRSLLFLLSCIAFCFTSRAEGPKPIPLWPEGAPGALGKEDKDIPTLTPILPKDAATASGAAMVIFPGGGYGALASYEGQDYGEWLATNGVSCFVVKY